MKVAGIDYSLTSPGICVYDGGIEWNYNNCSFFYFGNDIELLKYYEYEYPEYKSESERYQKLADWALNAVNGCDIVFIEGYSYGSSGRVFNIAENGGVLKNVLWKNRIPYEVLAPKQVKKFASGNGNASKKVMEDAFKEEVKLDLRDLFKQPTSKDSPSSDIIDAYYICKMGVDRLAQQK